MSRIRVEVLGEGQHPSERVVAVTTANGRETVFVDARSVRDSTLDVGYPVGSRDGQLLVELPRKTTTGQWRVWVDKLDVLDNVSA